MAYKPISIEYAAPAAGATVSVNGKTEQTHLIVEPAATLATLTIDLPNTPVEKQRVFITSTQIITLLTLTPILSIVNLISTLTAGGTVGFMYSSASGSGKWYKIL